MASSQGQSFPRHQLIFRVILGINSDHILPPAKMAVLQCFPADRDELAFLTGGSGRFGKPFDLTRPEQILFPFHNSRYQRLVLLIIPDRHPLLEFDKGMDSGKPMFFAYPCIPGFIQ